MVPLYEIFLGQRLRFRKRVLTWVLPGNNDIYGQHNSSCENFFLSNLVYSLNSCNICQWLLFASKKIAIVYCLLVR